MEQYTYIKKNNTPGSSADRQCIAPLCVTSEGVTSGVEQNSEKWTSVVYKNNKLKVTSDTNRANIANVHHHLTN